ncbi:MAG: glycoside hydrolase family 140 protein [Chitinophagaceae bacterium]
MKKQIVLCTTLLIFLIYSAPAGAQVLKVSDNKRYLVKADGTPFFWLGDTAWELIHRLTLSEADRYLKKRAEQGFTVIQAVVLAELDGLNDPTPEGYKPLDGNDPTKPNADYFKKVDAIIDLAGKYGLNIGLLPTWADKVNGDRGGATFTTANAQVYGKFLGNRYKNRANIIWILGGDRTVENPAFQAVWRAMAAGITDGVGGADEALITFHPRGGGSSSTYFHDDAWLDVNMQQTGHCTETLEHVKIFADYQLSPIKPIVNGEPIYEEHPVCFNVKDMGYSTSYDIRKAAYLSLFGGAFGHTYGVHAVWQFFDKNRRPINAPPRPWHESLDLAGANQLKFLKALMLSRPMMDRVPDQAVIADAACNTNLIQATHGKDYLFVYSAQGTPFALNLKRISGEQATANWYNPRTGEIKNVGTFDNTGQKLFTPPRNNSEGLDWVLIVDDASKKYPMPQVK